MIKGDYDIIIKNFPEFKQKISFEELSKTFVMVQSRTYDYNKNSAMIPFADMFNHQIDEKKNVIWTDFKNQNGFLLIADKPIKAGDPLHVCYRSDLNNELFLVNYGFLLNANE